jgi:hypothetical protein
MKIKLNSVKRVSFQSPDYRLIMIQRLHLVCALFPTPSRTVDNGSSTIFKDDIDEVPPLFESVLSVRDNFLYRLIT